MVIGQIESNSLMTMRPAGTSLIVMSNYVVIVWLILLCNGTTEKGVKERGRERGND